MNNKFTLLPLAALGLLAVVPAGAAPTGGAGPSAVPVPSYHLLKKVTLGGEGSWDYLNVDPAARRIYISRGTHVMVVDADTYKVVGDIPDTSGVHGIAIAPELGKGFVSDGRASAVTIFDLKTLKTLGTVTVGTGPDCIIYEPKTQRVFTFNGRDNSATAVDAKTGKVVGTIALGGRPEYAAVDGTGMVYDNLESTSEVVAIDAQALTIKNRWPLAPAEGPSGLAINQNEHQLFSTCDGGKMAISSTVSGKSVATAPIGNGPDAAAYDPGESLAFSSNGQDGTLTVLHEATPGAYTALQTVATEAGARTMALDTKTHQIFLVTATPDAANPGEGRRRNYVPGSFTLLVVGPQ
jgi:DNA-binding beta-propeller fold protein YncE